jgi:cytochrome c-type biogenesis protein CcmE
LSGTRWVLVGLVITGCLAYLVYSATGSSAEYYLTLSELRAQAHPASGDVRVLGLVQEGFERSEGGQHVRFTITDAAESLPVDYRGTLPDIFQPGIKVVVVGRPGAGGVFQARSVLAKCPSRFSSGAPST